MFVIDEIDDKIDFLNINISNSFDMDAPYITQPFSRPYCPWISENIHLTMKLRDKALGQARRDKDWDYYKNFRNFTKSSMDRKKAHLEFKTANTKRNQDLCNKLRRIDIRK
ncbi:hypothetical protein JTB14_002371 [Gonioctena quinquepunctata]|nr:hypothetical protein JTB14_002371 [Gonioctena quinquepunctata]